MRRVCPISGETFEVEERDLDFYSRIAPQIGERSFPIPPPRVSPRERFRRRLAWRNERHLYRTSCAVSGQPLISVFSPDKPFRIVDRGVWQQIDNRESGREYDFTRPFFEQFAELYRSTFKPNLTQSGEIINSDYAHFVGWLKNCYMALDSGQCEQCHYIVFCGYSRDCIDGMYLLRCELCYDSIKLEDCYRVSFSAHCTTCSFSAWLTDCIGCKNCIGCVNLRNQQYCVFNEQVSRATYEKLWNELFSGSHTRISEFDERYRRWLAEQPRRALHNVNCENVSGDYLFDCVDVHDSFYCYQAKRLRYCHYLYLDSQDCYDVNTWGEGMERCMELSGCGGYQGKVGMSDCLFGAYLYYGGYRLLYCVNCLDVCQDLFGCCDLRKQQFCILNKQYSKQEYHQLLPRIIEHMRSTGEWGEFFPIGMSPFGYNESVAQEELPLTRVEAADMGACWSTYESGSTAPEGALSAADLPDLISETSSTLLQRPLLGEQTAQPFRITAAELKVYRDLGLPVPREPFIERHRARVARLNPRALYRRKCAASGDEILTSFAPDSPAKVYSDAAYYREVVG